MLKSVLISLFLLFLFPSVANAQVVINEFVPNASSEWVEFKNASSSAEYLKDYYFDDDTNFGSDETDIVGYPNSPKKPLVSGLNTLSIVYPYFEFGSFLNNAGDFVVLFDNSGAIVDQYQYTSDPGSGVSVGRNPDGTGVFVVLDSTTKGAVNSGPMSTPTLTPTATPTSTPTSTPTPTPVKTPTPKPTVKAKATSKPTPTPEEEGNNESLLGAREELNTPTPTPEPEEKSKSKFPLVAGVMILGGGAFLGVASYPLLKQRLKGYNKVSDDSSKIS